MNKNFLSKNLLGLAALAIGVVLVIGFIVASDSEETTTTNNINVNDISDSDISDSDEEELADEDSSNDETETQENSETVDNEAGEVTLNSNEVATHNTATDCWTIVNGNVYDITEYIPSHPGGDEILRACGEDGTTLFTTGNTESGEQVKARGGHSTSAEIQLESFLKGALTN